jgi:hypothetical protein
MKGSTNLRRYLSHSGVVLGGVSALGPFFRSRLIHTSKTAQSVGLAE